MSSVRPVGSATRTAANLRRKTSLFMFQQHRMSSSTVAASAAIDYSSLADSGPIRDPWKPAKRISVTSVSRPEWKYGEGASEDGGSLTKKHVEIDPFAPGRPMSHNYSLLVSGIVPRPIGFASTVSRNGRPNLAPFSYFQVVDHDPPVFVIGFSGRPGRPKDTLRNLEDTGEICLNVVSEHMIEAVNATSLDAPDGVSEWELSGLHQAPSTTVKPSRVQESIFSIEGRLLETMAYKTSRPSAGPHGKLAIIEATRFWVREDAVDVEGRKIDLDVLRPLGQLGGISYARITETFQLPRRKWLDEVQTDGERLSKLIGEIE